MMGIEVTYLLSADDLNPEQLQGFFVGWPDPPAAETHLKLLRNSAEVVIALDQKTDRVIGFVSAITDGVLTAFIPLLEVLPPYQGQGIGQELMRRMLMRLDKFYAVDLLCDQALLPFYESAGMKPVTGMLRRNYQRQSGIDGLLKD